MLNADPNGRNINDGCGSTDPTGLARAVVELRADAGLAVDGDADRVVMVNASGELVDGDKMLAVLAFDLDDQGLLAGRSCNNGDGESWVEESFRYSWNRVGGDPGRGPLCEGCDG